MREGYKPSRLAYVRVCSRASHIKPVHLLLFSLCTWSRSRIRCVGEGIYHYCQEEWTYFEKGHWTATSHPSLACPVILRNMVGHNFKKSYVERTVMVERKFRPHRKKCTYNNEKSRTESKSRGTWVAPRIQCTQSIDSYLIVTSGGKNAA